MEDIKVHVKTLEEYIAVQKAWFNEGIYWDSDHNVKSKDYRPYLYIEGSTIYHGDCYIQFHEDTSKEVTVESILNPKKLIPHVHCELIKAWADGHGIQKYSKGQWVNQHPPLWYTESLYRIKPEVVKSPQELEKESILEEMEKLKQRLDKLEVKD